MTEHAKFSPSSANIWLNCSNSILLTDTVQVDTSTNEYAKEGTYAHELAAYALSNMKNYDKYPKIEIYHDPFSKPEKYKEFDIPNIYIDRYVRYINELILEYHKNGNAQTVHIYIEHKVNLNEHIYGTADCIIVRYDAFDNLTGFDVIDFKYGMNKVDAFENSQLTLYALAVAKDSSISITNATVHIVQPRINHFDSYTITEAFKEQIQLDYETSIYQVENKIDSYKVGSHCKYCKVKHGCSAILNEMSNLANSTINKEVDFELLSDLMKKRELFNNYLDSMESHLLEILQNQSHEKFNKAFKLFKLVHGRSTTKWKENAKEQLELLLGNDAYQSERPLITVTNAKKKLDVDIVDMLTFKVDGKLKVAILNDNNSEKSIIDEFNIIEI